MSAKWGSAAMVILTLTLTLTRALSRTRTRTRTLIRTLTLTPTRCGGNFSRVHLVAPGAEAAATFRLPSAEHQVRVRVRVRV